MKEGEAIYAKGPLAAREAEEEGARQKRPRGVSSVTMGAAKFFDRDSMMAYWVVSRNSVQEMAPTSLSVVQDCLDVSNHKVELSGVWHYKKEESFWAPPLVAGSALTEYYFIYVLLGASLHSDVLPEAVGQQF